MKRVFTLYLAIALTGVLLLSGKSGMAQTGILNPNDAVTTYNPAAPPATPPANTLAKWVRTVDFSWNSTEYKCYYYNGVPFRLKFPKTYGQDPAGTTYPMYIFFHGVGERGSIYDNEQQLYHGGQYMLQSVDNGTFDGFLVYPQSSSASGGWSAAQMTDLEVLINNYFIPQVSVDPNKIVLNGLSGGGDAVWLFMETYPSLVAAAIPMSSASTQDQSYATNTTLLYTPIWMLSGGLDNNPAPYTAEQLDSTFVHAGADMTYKLYTTLGHDTWDSTWLEPNYWPYLNAGNKTNPWTVGGRNQFCPGTAINLTLGVTAGFTSYQWRKNGVAISGANSNSYNATSVGIYDVSIERGTTWSYYSPHPDTISYMAPTVSPNIAVNGLASDVLPAPNGQTTVGLTVPAGYQTYTWERVDSPATLSSKTNVLSNVTPGSYAVEVTQLYGCSSSFSTPFVVEKASGPNPPGTISGLTATTLSQTQIKLNWTESASQTYPETQFEIYQSTAIGGPYTLVGFSPAYVDSFMVTTLNSKTAYYFEVRPINATAAAAVSSAAGATTTADIQPPTAPGGLSVVTTSSTSVSLIWNQSTDNVGVVFYDIYVNGNKVYSLPNSASSPDTTYTVYNLTNGSTYNFIVRARDQAGNVSPSSNQLTAIAEFSGLNYSYYNLASQPSVLPNFPTLTPAFSGNMPNVSIANATATVNFAYIWNGYINIPAAGNYVFQTVSDDGSEVWLGGLNQTAYPYSYTTKGIVVANQPQGATATNSATLSLQAGVYPISIAYFQAAGGYSMLLNWSTPSSGGSFVAVPNSAFVQNFAAAGAAPTAPTNLTGTVNSSEKVTLNWSDTATNATGFQLFRSASLSGPFVTVGTVPASKMSYSDSALTAATTYYYQVIAINNYGSSSPNVVPGGKLTVNYYALSSAPSTLPNYSTMTPTSTFTDTTFGINFTNAGVNWTATYTGYIIIPTAGVWTFNTNSDDGSALYIDGVEVVNNNGLHGGTTITGTATLTAGAHTIQVQYFQAGGGQQLSAQISGPGISLENIPASMLGQPAISVTTSGAPVIPAAPSGLTGTVMGSNKVALAWTDNDTNAIRYQVWRSPVTDAAYALVTTLNGHGTNAYTDSSLTQSSVYYYKVLALNEGGSSPFSNEVRDSTTANPTTIVTMAEIPVQNLYNDTTATITLAATSNFGTTLTYSSTTLPAFATLSTNNNVGTLTLAPNNAQLGTFTAMITATDNYGGKVIDTFTINVTGRNQDVIMLNVNSQNPQAAPWNNLNANPTAGLTVNNLVDINGVTTTVGIINENLWSANRIGITTVNNNGLVPNNVSQTYYYGTSGTGYQMELTGLNPNLVYELKFYAGFAWTASYQASYGNLLTTYAVNGQSVTLNCAYDTTTWAVLTDLQPNSSGQLLITISKPTGSYYEMLAAMEIISYSAPTSVAALITPSSLTAYGTSTSKIQVNWAPTGDIVTGYQIWRSTSPVGTYALDGTVATGTTSFIDSGLMSNTTYFYEVREVVNGPAYSGFSNPVGGSTVAYQVNLNLNEASTYAENNGQWNNLNTLTYPGFTLSNMANTLGQSTGMNFNVIKNFDGWNAAVGITTGNNSGVVPDTVMNKVYYENFGDSCNFSISGLTKNSVYNMSFYGGTNYNYATNTTYRIGSQTVNLNALNNTTQLATLYNLTPDSTGTITVWLNETVGYGFLNGLEVFGMPSPTTVAYDSTGGGGIATYLATTTGLMIGDAAIDASTGDSLTVSTAPMGAYPNPFIDQVTVSTTFKANVPKLSMVLVDMSGHVLQVNEFSNVYAGPWQQTLLMSSVPPGVYKLELIGVTGERPRVFTLVKLK